MMLALGFGLAFLAVFLTAGLAFLTGVALTCALTLCALTATTFAFFGILYDVLSFCCLSSSFCTVPRSAAIHHLRGPALCH